MSESTESINETKIDLLKNDTKWNEEDDIILKEWVDKSACFKWLHEKSYKIYKKQYLSLMIPVIIISTLTGAANFALERIPSEEYQGYASLIVGTFNIIAAIVSTVAQFLKTAELKECHNIASKSWDKFNRILKLELQKKPTERNPKNEIFKIAMKEYDRLVELSPDIPNKVLEEFKNIYKNVIDLIKPEIAGFIVSSKVYEPKSYQINDSQLNINKPLNEELILKNEFIQTFKTKYGRIPTNDEINDHLELSTISIA